MKKTKTHASLAVLALSVSLASCGGGGDDEAGSPTSFNVQPAEIIGTASAGTPANQCAGGYLGDVAVVGGAAPYRLINTDPARILLHRSSTDFTPVSSVSDRNGTFSVTFGSSCFDPSLIVVADKLDQQVVLTLRNKPTAAAAPASAASS